MASDLEMRVVNLEQLIANRIQYDIQQLKNQMQTLSNDQRLQAGAMGGGGGGSGGAFFCLPTGAMDAASGPAPDGEPATLEGQTVYQWTVSGGYASVSTSATIVNVSEIATVAAGSTAYLAQNPDGTFTVLTQPQTCGS